MVWYSVGHRNGLSELGDRPGPIGKSHKSSRNDEGFSRLLSDHWKWFKCRSLCQARACRINYDLSITGWIGMPQEATCLTRTYGSLRKRLYSLFRPRVALDFKPAAFKFPIEFIAKRHGTGSGGSRPDPGGRRKFIRQPLSARP